MVGMAHRLRLAVFLAVLAAVSVLPHGTGHDPAPSGPEAQATTDSAARKGRLATDAVAGALVVIDADTFDVGGERVRLYGVDAPERDQTCLDPLGRSWACGEWVTEQVRLRWGGQPAECEGVTRDRYGRLVARCAVGGEDLGAVLVAEGIAFAYRAYSRDYVAIEDAAREAGAGMWRGRFTAPWDHRTQGRAPQQTAASSQTPGECAIKGNISGSGRLYHVPGGRHYDRTTIDPTQGERWFCTEAEAEAAGWRAAR
jgi:endonuclease YncB( thermonuclease family)